MSINYIGYQLRLAKDHDLVVSLYTDRNDPEAFCTGIVEQVSARHVLLAAYTPWGKLDGWILWRINEVHQVFCADSYEIRMEMLAQALDQQYVPLGLENPLGMEGDLLGGLLVLAMEQGRTVSLIGPEETYTGRIIALDDLRVTLDALDFWGRPLQEKVALRLRDVIAISLGTEEEKMFDLLRETAKNELFRLSHPEGGTPT